MQYNSEDNLEESPQSIRRIAEQTPVQGIQKPASKKFLWIAIIAVVVIVILAVIMLKKEKNGDGGTGNGGVVLKGSFEERLKTCLEKSWVRECDTMFTSIGMDEYCARLGDSIDKCLYKAALINAKAEYCNAITNESLKENCYNEIIDATANKDIE